MTITTNDTRDEYTASAGQTVFNYTFKIFADTDLNVYQTPAGQTANDTTDLITAYTVAGVGASAGGTITLTTPASAGDLITIVSDIPESRTTDYQYDGDFIPDVVNDDFDRVVSLVKQVNDRANRGLAFQESEQGSSGFTLPQPQAGYYVRWNGTLDGFENVPFTTTDPGAPSLTVATLANVTDADTGDWRYVQGYSTIGDGGHGVWVLTAGNFTTELANDPLNGVYLEYSGEDGSTRAWVRQYSGKINSLWFGGKTNTTIQAAGDFAHSLGGGIVTLPVGQYTFSAYVDYTGWRGVTIEGEGATSGWSAADAAGGGPTNTGKSCEIVTSGNIPAFYGEQGNSATDRTRKVVWKNINFTGNDESLGSGNYGIQWYQSDAAVFAGTIDIINCMFYGFENGIRITSISGTQATGWWKIKRSVAQNCYWGMYAPGGINDFQMTDCEFYQNDYTGGATSNILTDAYGGGVYGKGTAWRIKGVDFESCPVGAYLANMSGFTIDGCYFEGQNVAKIIVNSCKDGHVGSSYGSDEIVIANSQSITVDKQQIGNVRCYGQNRDIDWGKNLIDYDMTADLTADNQNISVYTQQTYQFIPQVIGHQDYRTIITEAINSTATVDNASTDIPSPVGGPYVSKITTTGTNQYARTYLSNAAWASGEWVNGLMFLYVPTAFSGLLSVSLVGSGGTEVTATLSYYPRDKWFYVDLRAYVTSTSTYTDFRIVCSITGQVFYMYKPIAVIANIDIDPFIVYAKFSDTMDSSTVNPILMPGNCIYFGDNKIIYGTGTPESVVVGRIGDLFIRTDGGSSTTLYVKETSTATSTGWAAK